MPYKFLYKFLIAAFVMSNGASAEYMPFKQEQIGEYYEYDIEGTPKDQALRKYRKKSTKIVISPLKASLRGARISRKALKKTFRAVEAYLSGHKKPYNHEKNLQKGLSDWETALSFAPKEKSKTAPGMLYIPREAWRLLKYSLYLAGFRLPRESAKMVKNMVYGTCGFTPQK